MTEAANKLLHGVAQFLFYVGGVIYRGWLSALAWDLVVVPLGAVAINTWHALAIIFLWNLMFFRAKADENKKEKTEAEKWTVVIILPVVYTIVFFTIWLLSKGF